MKIRLGMARFTVWMIFFCFPFCLSGQVPRLETQTSSQTRPSDRQSIEVLIPSNNGVLQWHDVATSLGEALKLDSESVQNILPRGQLDLRSDTVLLVLMGINLAAGESISFEVVCDGQNRDSLCVRCDRNLLGKRSETTRRSASIQIDDDWPSRSVGNPVVIFLHGLRGDAAAFDPFREFLRKAGYATAAASYDDDESIAESARQVSIAAEQIFGSNAIEPSLALVGHSMGGLVARQWAEDPDLHGQRISKLITIGTPHAGSNWASLPPLLDLFSDGEFDHSDLLDVIVHQPSAAGLRDLKPDSDFLSQLAACSRRDDVAYTVIVGTGSPVTDGQVVQLRETLRGLDREGSVLRLLRPRIQPLMESFDELIQGKGDGIVSVRRAMIPDVDDTVLVDASHFEMIRPIPGQTEHSIWKIVLDRLAR